MLRVAGCGEKMPSEKALVTPFLLRATDGTAGLFGSAAALSSAERLHPVAAEGGYLVGGLAFSAESDACAEVLSFCLREARSLLLLSAFFLVIR